MRFLALVAVATSLTTLSDALRPPPSLDQVIVGALPEGDFGRSKRVIEMPCPECRVGPSKSVRDLPLDYEPRPGETFPESVLRVNISIFENGDTDQLMVNDCSFHPLPSGCSTVWTDQFVKSACGDWEYAASPNGAFTLTMHHLDDNIGGLGIKLQVLQLVVGRLASKLIYGERPEIKVKFLIFPTGQILIATDPTRIPTKGPASNPDCSHHSPSDHHWRSRYMSLLGVAFLNALMHIIIVIIMAVMAFYVGRSRFLRRQRSTDSEVPPEVDRKDEDKILSYFNHPDAPLLDEDAPLMRR